MSTLQKQTDRDVVQSGKNEEGQTDVQSDTPLMIYGVTDVPPPVFCFLFALQQTLMGLSATFVLPLVIADLICARDQPDVKAALLSTSFFVCGISTIIQTLFEIRLGIFQGSSIAFLAPVVVMMTSQTWSCSGEDMRSEDAWKSRMNEIQGNLMLASLTQVVLGCTGVFGLLIQRIGPLTITPVMALIILPNMDLFSAYCEGYLGIAFLVIVLMVIFNLFLYKYKIPIPFWRPKRGCHVYRLQLFQLFPVFLSIAISWIVCYILTETDSIPNNSTLPSYKTRTDARSGTVERAPWFYWPYPFKFGMPTMSGSGYIGFLAACFASIIESLGDYYTAAKLSGVRPPPPHAINRGIAVEGVGGILSGMFGIGHGMTSYSHNIAMFSITKVASRSVFVLMGFIFILCGVVGKFGAVLSTMPDPIVGGILIGTLGIIVIIAFSFVRFTDVNSNRSVFILGLAVMIGLMLPKFITDEKNSGAIDTGNKDLDQILRVLLGSPMLVGGILGFTLDNIVPGTEAERGIKNMLHHADSGSGGNDVYELPFINKCVQRTHICTYVPISPTFNVRFSSACCKNKKDMAEDSEQDSTELGVDNKAMADEENVPGATHL